MAVALPHRGYGLLLSGCVRREEGGGMNPELERVRTLAGMLRAAEGALDDEWRSLRETVTALLRTGEASLAEVSEASGLDQGELLEMLSRSAPGREPAWRRS